MERNDRHADSVTRPTILDEGGKELAVGGVGEICVFGPQNMIVVSGFKVFPNRIADVVALHPGVAGVVRDGQSGEIGAQGVRLAVRRLADRVTMPVATQRGATAAS